MLQLIGTIAVVASVLVLAYQAREVVHQTRTANEVSGTVAHRELVFQWERWARVFIHRPELHSLYFGDPDTEPSDADRVRLAVIAEGVRPCRARRFVQPRRRRARSRPYRP